VTLIFCPGLRFVIPISADEPDGFGTTLSGAAGFVVGDLEGAGFAFGDFEDAGFADEDFEGAGFFSPSLRITLIFCPGFKFSTPTPGVEPFVDGLIRTDLVGEGVGCGCAVLDGVGEGVGFTEGLGVGFTDGFGVVVGLGLTVGVGEGFGDTEGVGVTVGSGVTGTVGVEVSVGDGVTTAGTPPPPNEGAGLDGVGLEGARYVTCSGVTGSEGSDAADGPTDVTVVTVNVYGVPFVRPLTVIGEDVPVTVSPVSTTVTT
jgi:hypothetical protein